MATVATSMSTTNVRITILQVLYVMSCFTVMNLSHVITEFSFGKYFPEITQPLDNSFEITHDRMLFFSGCDPGNILQISLHINTIFESSQRPTSHHAPNHYIRTSTA